jgi:hypothetical protein
MAIKPISKDNASSKKAKTATTFVARSQNGKQTIACAFIAIALQVTYDICHSIACDILTKAEGVKLATSLGQQDRLIISRDVKAAERASWSDKQKAMMAWYFSVNATVNATNELKRFIKIG